MRITNPTAVATAAATALIAVTGVAATAAAATPATATESFVMTFQTFRGTDQPTRVAAAGPISGAGIETQTDQDTPTGEMVVFTWHLPEGTVTADAVEQYDFTPDYRSCTAKATGTGTWTIVSGTGAYTGAAGSGTFVDHGRFVGARDSHGSCDPNAEPVLSTFLLRGSGTVSLGASA
jgi:hypothetical protein